MSNRMSTYRAKATVKARQVSAKDGESVVTFYGAGYANKGDYVVESGGALFVVEKETFEAQYTSVSRPAKKAAAKKAVSPKARVEAAKKATAGK
jgi:hypothetical protein